MSTLYTVGYGARYSGPSIGVGSAREQRQTTARRCEEETRGDFAAGLLLIVFQLLLLALAAALPSA